MPKTAHQAGDSATIRPSNSHRTSPVLQRCSSSRTGAPRCVTTAESNGTPAATERNNSWTATSPLRDTSQLTKSAL